MEHPATAPTSSADIFPWGGRMQSSGGMLLSPARRTGHPSAPLTFFLGVAVCIKKEDPPSLFQKDESLLLPVLPPFFTVHSHTLPHQVRFAIPPHDNGCTRHLLHTARLPLQREAPRCIHRCLSPLLSSTGCFLWVPCIYYFFFSSPFHTRILCMIRANVKPEPAFYLFYENGSGFTAELSGNTPPSSPPPLFSRLLQTSLFAAAPP